MESEWKSTACILCECNCGIEVKLGGEDGRRLVKFRGDKLHPISKGYACEKPHRLDYYQNGPDRLLTPQRRKADGTFESVSWETAISEIAHRLGALRDTYGGNSIFYYGGGGQGNHLPGAYATATRRALKSRYRSSALAQEKTGEFWVSERMVGALTRADFEHCDVAMFLGKNPWYSHSIPRARVQLKELSKDPERTLIVVDPRRTKTAELADIHLQVRPGTDAWLLSAMIAILVTEDRVDHAFLEAHTEGYETVRAAFADTPIAAYCEHAGVEEALVRKAVDAIASAKAFASFEDLGVQMNKHSTLVSYLHRLLWLPTGHFARPGTVYVPTTLVPFADGKHKRDSPVVGAKIVGGMVPCNVIPDEVLTDHEDRYRGMIVEAANPAHSLADSARMREALQALDTLVVIDVAMTETARLADYVLPASTQFEKAEATFFNFEFPENAFHLRAPLVDAPEGPLSEAEIHARLTEALVEFDPDMLDTLKAAASRGQEAYAAAFTQHVAFNPKWSGYAPVLLYRTLGPSLPEGMAAGAVVWGLALRCAVEHGPALKRAGFGGSPAEAANALFESVLANPSGVVFAKDDWEGVWKRVSRKDRTLQLALDDLLADVADLRAGPAFGDEAFPFVLSAGERRAFTANTIVRDPAWRTKDAGGSLRMHPDDALRLSVSSGDTVRLTTRKAAVQVPVEVSDTMRAGHVSLPNGMGLMVADDAGRGGVAPNELTASEDRDPYLGTPWHKYVPARVEALA